MQTQDFIFYGALLLVVGLLAMIVHRWAPWGKKSATGSPRPADPGIYHPDPTATDTAARLAAVQNWINSRVKYYEELIEWKQTEHEQSTPQVFEWVYVVGCAIVIGASILYILAVETWVPGVLLADLGFPINPRWFLYIPLVVYLALGFRKVDVNQVAGADFFGEPVFQFDSGPKWIPFGIFNFNKESTTFVQAEFPGDADQIQWTDEKEDLKEGKVRPLYLITGENPAVKGEARLPTDIQMNIGVAEYVQFRLVKSRFFDLEINIGDIDPTKVDEIRRTITSGADLTPKMFEAVRQMRDTSSAFLIEVLGQISLNEIRREMSLLNKLLKLMLQSKVMNWGLELVDGHITKTNGGHEFSKKIQDRADAISARDSLVTLAEGEKAKRILEGQGSAAAELASLEAKAKGYEAIAEKIKTPEGAAAMQAEVARELAASGNVIIVGTQGVADLLGIAEAVKKRGAKP